MNHEKLNTLLERFVADMGATGSAGLMVIGNRLGLYTSLNEGRATPEQFAQLRDAFAANRLWQPVFSEDGTVVFRYGSVS